MLILNKLLPVFVLPLGWVFVLLVCGVLRKRRLPVIFGMVLLYGLSMPCVGRQLIWSLESRYAPIAVGELQKADAIVVLGGFLGAPVTSDYLPNVSESVERLEAGIVLSQQHKGDWLVFTGARLPWNVQAEVEGERSKRIAAGRGVLVDRILVTRDVGNTFDESVAVAELVKRRQWGSIVLVTSAIHMPRAARLFRKAGVPFTPFPVDYRVDPRSTWNLLDFLPRADALGGSELALREWYGLAFYALSGR